GVNQAPGYERLRQLFSARILADWYKRKQRGRGSLAHMIDQSSLEEVKSTSAWSPQQIWKEFKRDYDEGRFRGFGGVDFAKMPIFKPTRSGSHSPLVLLNTAIMSRTGGLMYRGVYRAGRIFVAVREPSRGAMVSRWLAVLTLLCLGVFAFRDTAKHRGW